MRHLLLSVLVVCVIGIMVPSVFAEDKLPVPAWIKNNAGWWADGQIPDSAFLQGIQFLIKEGIMVIPATETSGSSESQGVPAWVKNNAGWWADGQIDDNAFISGIQYLIKSGIIVVEQEQTQPTATDKEIQKLADEYLDCFMGVADNSPSCVAWDEDKYAIGGIEERVYISGYMVFDGCPGCDWQNDYHDPVDVKLEKFQDEDLHKQLFDMYVSITPKQILDEVVFLYISTDDYGGKEVAAVYRDEINPFKYALSIDPVDMVPSAESMDEMFHKAAMIHENGHILSLGSSQGDNDMVTGYDLWVEPYTEVRKITQEKESACAPNYFTAVAGCMKDNSYLNLFFQKFWADIYPVEFFAGDKTISHDVFFNKYHDRFVSIYASTNVEEDFAESFSAFVLWDDGMIDDYNSACEKESRISWKDWNPTPEIGDGWVLTDQNLWFNCPKSYPDNSIWEEKIRFFYDFPELVEMRDFIRSNL